MWIINLFKTHSFTQKLAHYPPKLRYIAPKQLWMAMRLGLYQTVLSNKPIFTTPKLQVVRLIAALKRQTLNDERASAAIFDVLNQQKFAKFHREFVREVFYLYPKVFVSYFEKHPAWLADAYYVGLYLSYKANDAKDHRDERIASLLARLPHGTDQLCLVNNLQGGANIALINQMLQLYRLTPLTIFDGHQLTVKCLQAGTPYDCTQAQKVTVLVTAFNAEQTIATCLNSLLNQTWRSLEVIVVDDASTDNTFKIIQTFAKQDTRVIGIHLPKNVGTFAAKSIGAKFATGEFLTCQDSDDFAHPQKIERQVVPLIDCPELIATTSYWLRLDDNGMFYARQYYPFLRQNPASPLFRRVQVIKEAGLWHVVRAGADSEFWHRLKLYYGDHRILPIKEPLTFASHRSDSLMNAGEFGVHDKASALRRLDYWEVWNLWHIKCLSKKIKPTMPNIIEQMANTVFEVDQRLLVNPCDIRYNLDNLTIEKQDD